MQETSNYNLKKYESTDVGSFLSGFNPNMDVLDTLIKNLSDQDATFANQLQTMLSQHITPIFVDATSEMTNQNSLYVLKSSGKIYSYNTDTSTFENTGISYTPDITSYYNYNIISQVNTAISDLTEPGFYEYTSGVTPTDNPFESALALLVFNFDGRVSQNNIQICMPFTTGTGYNSIYWRHKIGSGSYSNWRILKYENSEIDKSLKIEFWSTAKTKYGFNLFEDINIPSCYYAAVSGDTGAPTDSPWGISQPCRIVTLTMYNNDNYRVQIAFRYNTTEIQMRWTYISSGSWVYSDWNRIDNNELIKKVAAAFRGESWQGNSYGFELLSDINFPSTFYISVSSTSSEPEDAPVPSNVAGRCTTLCRENDNQYKIQLFNVYNTNKMFIRWTRISSGQWVYSDWQPLFDSDWYNKVWYAYGTSMTAYVNQSLSTGLTGKGYAAYLPALSGLKLTNKGKGGTGIIPSLHGGLDDDNMYTRVMDNTDGKLNADLITLEIIPNDMSGTLGELSDVWDGVEGSDSETFMGCLANLLTHLLSTTTAQIVVLIAPTSRYQLNHPENTYTAENHITWLNWIKAVKDKCAIYQVPVISCSDGCALSPARVNGNNTYVGDQIHLVAAGGYNLAQFYWSKLKDIPIWYTSAQ